MGDSSLQTTQYGCTRWMYESAFKCYAEVHGVYLDKWRFGIRRLKLSFLQLANDLRDSALISDLHARLRKMANKVDDMQYKVEDIHTYLFNLERPGTRRASVSDTHTRQEMPLKPMIFHGRDDLVEDIAQLLLQKETSHVCILGPGGMGKTSFRLPS